MSLWKRKRECLGYFYQVPLIKGPDVSKSDHTNNNFNPCGDKPKDLVNYLLKVQKCKFDVTILDTQFSYPILMKHAKTLLTKYEPIQIKKAIKISIDYCQHPFSFKQVEKICKE